VNWCIFEEEIDLWK